MEYTIDIPMAQGKDLKSGWTFDLKWLRKIEQKTLEGDHVVEEEIEEVMLAVLGIKRNPLCPGTDSDDDD